MMTGRQQTRDATYRSGQAFDVQAGHVKTDAEKSDEAGDVEAVRLDRRKRVLQFAQQEFYKYRQADAEAGASTTTVSAPDATTVAPLITTGNPWHANMSREMFWM
jgi:hypothetical protein